MNINKVAIDTMGKADDPAIDKDIEREAYYEAKLKEIEDSVPSLEILNTYDIKINCEGEEYGAEEALCLIEENGSAEPLRLIMEAAIARRAEYQTQRKYGC